MSPVKEIKRRLTLSRRSTFKRHQEKSQQEALLEGEGEDNEQYYCVFYPLYLACLSTNFNATWGPIGNWLGFYVQLQLKNIKSTGMRHTKYRVKLQKYMFIDDSYCRNGEIDTITVRVLKRLKMCLLSLSISATVRTHFLLAFCTQISIVVVI